MKRRSVFVSLKVPSSSSSSNICTLSFLRSRNIIMPLVGITSRPSASEKETADEAEEGAHTLGEVQQLEKFAICPQNSRPIPLLVVAISSLYSGVRAVGGG
jgi:hypothetical protein